MAGEKTIANLSVRIGADARAFLAEMNKSNVALNKFGKSTKSFSGTISSSFSSGLSKIAAGAVGLMAVSKLTDVYGDIKQTISEFETSLNELSSITGATGDDLDYLKDKAIELSTATDSSGVRINKSAKDILDAMKLVGSAKPELLQTKEALAEVTKQAIILSQAGGRKFPLETAVSAMTSIMNQFGLGASEASRTINVLAAGAKYGAAEVPYLSESIVKCGVVAKTAGLSIEDVTGIMEVFGEKGIQAEIAGTGFRNVLLFLQKDAKNYTNGQFDFNKALGNLTPIMNNTIELEKIFGRENVVVAQTLAQNSERFKELTGLVTGTNVAYEQSITNTKGWTVENEIAKNKWDALVLSMDTGQGVLSKLGIAFAKLKGAVADGLTALAEGAPDKARLQFDGLMESVSKFSPKEQLSELSSLITVYSRNIEKMKKDHEAAFNAMNKRQKAAIDKPSLRGTEVSDYQIAEKELIKYTAVLDMLQGQLANVKVQTQGITDQQKTQISRYNQLTGSSLDYSKALNTEQLATLNKSDAGKESIGYYKQLQNELNDLNDKKLKLSKADNAERGRINDSIKDIQNKIKALDELSGAYNDQQSISKVSSITTDISVKAPTEEIVIQPRADASQLFSVLQTIKFRLIETGGVGEGMSGIIGSAFSDVTKAAMNYVEYMKTVDSSLKNASITGNVFGDKIGEISEKIQIQNETLRQTALVYGENSEAVVILKGELTNLQDQYTQLTKEEAFVLSMNQMLGDAIVETFTAIASAVVSGQDVFAAIGATLGGFLEKIGAAFMAYGIAVAAFESAFEVPWVAIVAGAALIIAGLVVKNLAAKGPETPSYAEGGIITKEHEAIVGDNPNEPEVGFSLNPVAPKRQLSNGKLPPLLAAPASKEEEIIKSMQVIRAAGKKTKEYTSIVAPLLAGIGLTKGKHQAAADDNPQEPEMSFELYNKPQKRKVGKGSSPSHPFVVAPVSKAEKIIERIQSARDAGKKVHEYTSVIAPMLAGGGMVKKPTVVIAGDNANASQDPEAIMPVSKFAEFMPKLPDMTNMIGPFISHFNRLKESSPAQTLMNNIKSQPGNIQIDLAGEFKINGDDLLLQIRRAEHKRNRGG